MKWRGRITDIYPECEKPFFRARVMSDLVGYLPATLDVWFEELTSEQLARVRVGTPVKMDVSKRDPVYEFGPSSGS